MFAYWHRISARFVAMLATAAVLALGAGCTSIPSMPDEREVPVQEIVTTTICELRSTFMRLSDKKAHPGFRADEWGASIQLTPRVDTDVSLKFGMTRKSTLDSKALSFVTWTLGTQPGAELDVRGRRDGSATFVLHSSELVKRNDELDMLCTGRERTMHALAQYQGIYEWWSRLIVQEAALAQFTKLDKPAFNSNIIVKFDIGNAGPTWVIPRGTTTFTVFGLRTVDLTLSLAFTRDPKRPRVVTLPEGGLKQQGPPVRRDPVSPDAQQRLDSIQQENILRNLRIQAQ